MTTVKYKISEGSIPSLSGAGKPWVLNSQFTPSIYNRMKQQITLSNLATIDPINIERKINQPILHISIGIEL